MKQAQTIIEFTLVVAFVLFFIGVVLNHISIKGIEHQATFGADVSGSNTVVVPPMTP